MKAVQLSSIDFYVFKMKHVYLPEFCLLRSGEMIEVEIESFESSETMHPETSGKGRDLPRLWLSGNWPYLNFHL